jgi:hypothetical protein
VSHKFALWIEGVDDWVGVVLVAGCEDDDLVELAGHLQELLGEGADVYVDEGGFAAGEGEGGGGWAG